MGLGVAESGCSRDGAFGVVVEAEGFVDETCAVFFHDVEVEDPFGEAVGVVGDEADVCKCFAADHADDGGDEVLSDEVVEEVGRADVEILADGFGGDFAGDGGVGVEDAWVVVSVGVDVAAVGVDEAEVGSCVEQVELSFEFVG